MARSKRDRYESERQTIKDLQEDGEISQPDAEAILEFLDAKDPQTIRVNDANDSGKADGTLASYAFHTKRIATLADFELTEATVEDVNRFCDDLLQGSIDGMKHDGLSKGSVKNYQSVLRKFYEYHGWIGKSEITLLNPDSGSVDERDIFTKKEIQAIRDAAKHPRDQALVDMLIYTGQRLSALLNLRLKDIRPEDREFYLNEEAGDLKGASGKRPLLYAEKAARDWKRQHPCSDDPEAYFFTSKFDINWDDDDPRDFEVGNRLDNSSVYNQLQRIGDRAGVDKPMNAHNFRHTFVTIAKRDYRIDNDTIKRLIGHRPDSNIMETTYAHLTDDDVISEAERATGIREDEPDSPLTPEVCDNCDEPVPVDDAKACPSCGIVFTPDAKATEEQIDDAMWESKSEAEGEQEDMVDSLKEAIENNPEKKAELIEMLGLDGAE